jgi:hypothetical protein
VRREVRLGAMADRLIEPLPAGAGCMGGLSCMAAGVETPAAAAGQATSTICL